MKSVFENALVFILITVGSLILSVMIAANIQIGNAREFHTNSIDRIQASFYSQSVINDLQNKASENGYTLSVTELSVYEDLKDYKVTLTYDVKVPLLGIVKSGTLEGYAR